MKTLRMLFRNEHHFDFPAMWRKALVGSAVLVLVSVGALVFRGLNPESSLKAARRGK